MLKERKRPVDTVYSGMKKKQKYSGEKINSKQEPSINTKKYNVSPKGDTQAREKSAPNVHSTEKTDWAKFKREKKELRLKRKKSKDYYEILVDVKKMYEKLRCKRTQNKNDLAAEMFSLIENTIQKLAMAHDTTRIIQCMLKHASSTLREKITESLLPVAIDMSTSKYAHFCVIRMFKYGTTISKSQLLNKFFGSIVKLCCHNISSKILDLAYLTIADEKQKNYMRQEFYSDLYKNSKDDSVNKLSDTYKDTPHMKEAVLGSVKANLEHVANKHLVDNSLVHAVILEYLHECDGEKLEETITSFSPLIPMLITTKEGCQAAIICFHQSSLKNRRAIIKSIKDHLFKICTHEQGHIFILAILNSLDDTKAMKKSIYDPIHPELHKIVSNKWGQRVIKWFISPADTKAFHPKFIAEIEESLKYGKKEKEIRRKEILDQIEEPIADAIVENPEFWLSTRTIGMITSDILNKISSSNFAKASSALATVICNPTWLVEENCKNIDEEDQKITKSRKFVEKNLIPGIEEPGLHIALKKIIKHDLERQSSAENKTFGSILVENISEDAVKHWLNVNRACFILLLIVENNAGQVSETIRTLIEPHKNLIDENKHIGGKFLLQKLQL